MDPLVIVGIIVHIIILGIFYNGLREKLENGENITVYIILLLVMYVPPLILLIDYLKN